MAAVTGWVREILLVVILGWVLEMMVPAESMRRYMRLVIGLLVLLAVLHPFLTLIGTPLRVLLPDSSSQNLATYVAQGMQMRTTSETQILEDYRLRLAADAVAVAEGVPWVQSAQATVSIQSSRSAADFGAVSGAIVGVSPEAIRIAPVEIGPQGSVAAGVPTAVAAAVQDRVAAALGIRPSQVSVQRLQGTTG